MRCLLDTNVVHKVLFPSEQIPPELVSQYQQLTCDELCISSITCAELKAGILRLEDANFPVAKKKMIADRVDLILSSLPILPFDAKAAVETARIQWHSRKIGRQLSNFDACIAGHAISLGIPLISDDRRAFEDLKFPDLQWMDWKNLMLQR